MFEQPDVSLRRTDKDGDLVEANARAHFVEDSPGDLHALAPLAWGGEEPDVPCRVTFLERRLCKHEPAQRHKIRIAGLDQHLRLEAFPLQPLERLDVAERDRDEHVRARGDERAHELELDTRIERDVEEKKSSPEGLGYGAGCRVSR